MSDTRISPVITPVEITPIERVMLARHPRRHYTSDLIQNLFTDFVEVHGDRRFADDPALTCGMANYYGIPVAVIGHQKGRDVNERRFRNFGMPKPEGYRKALRLMLLAEKFGRPIITFVDTPGAYPGIDAEERGQAEAIAYNLQQAAKLRVPIVTIIVGEGGSGGALAIGVCDTLLMMENAVYSVISPEGCAAILWKNPAQSGLAATRLKLTAIDLQAEGIVDEVIPEPPEGWMVDGMQAYEAINRVLHRCLSDLLNLGYKERVERRHERLRGMGKWFDSSVCR